MPRRSAGPNRGNGRNFEAQGGEALRNSQDEFGHERLIRVDGESLQGDLEIH